MDTLGFLQRVLPSEGLYVSTVINAGDKVRQGFYTSVSDLAKVTSTLSERGNNVYYAVASFVDKANGRRQTNVNKIKSLFLDIDCGQDKPFTNAKEGAKALSQFLSTSGMPRPLVVSSGNGLHVYWTLTEELSPDEWKPLANALKAAAKALSFDVDPAVPADSARVLRPIGTINPKGGKPVRLLVDAPDYEPDVLRTILAKYQAMSRLGVAQAPKPRSTGITIVDSEYPPAVSAVVASKCQNIHWAVNNQQDVPEPFWFALLGIAAHCENPEQTAVEWSQHHPGYDYDATIRKMEHWKNSTTGPATCARFGDERPKGCKDCRFAGRIKSPAQLGSQEEAIEVSKDAPDEIASTVPLPKSYKRTSTGIKITIDETDVDICPFDIYPVSYGRDETLGYETVRFRWKRQHVGWQPLVFRQAFLTEESVRDFAGVIADQGIVLITKKQTASFQFMLRAYMDELRKVKAMTNLHAAMGWKEGNTQFLLGNKLYRANESGVVTGEEVSLAQASIRMVAEMYSSAGTLESAAMFTSLFEKAKLPLHGWAMLVSMSAPLYAFTGLKGLAISLYGPTGSGKTLAQLIAQSVWGNPDQLHYSAKFTQNALYSRMGLFNNLPMTIDEATTLPAKDVGEFLYDVSQGKEKARLGRNTEERVSKTWRLPCILSSNKSLNSMLMTSGMESDAQMMRLLELSVMPHPLFTKSSDAGKRIYRFVTTHYGMIGQTIVQKLVELGPTVLAHMIEEHEAWFKQEYDCKFTGGERYWEQCIVLADMMGKLATEWGLIQFDYRASTMAVLNQMGAVRKVVENNRVGTFDLISEYITENSTATLVVMQTGGNKPQPDFNRLPREGIRIRFELMRDTANGPFTRGTMLVDRMHFKRWLATRGADYRTIMRDVAVNGMDATPPLGKAYLGKDSPLKQGQVYVLGIDLTAHPRLQGILTDADDAASNSSMAGLTVIQGGAA